MSRPKGSKNKKTIAAAAATVTAENISRRIEEVEAEIKRLAEEQKAKKAELKKLIKERDSAARAEARKKAEANKAAIMAAVESSSKSIDEILEFLK